MSTRSREQLIAEMTAAVAKSGDSYRAPDGVRYLLVERL